MIPLLVGLYLIAVFVIGAMVPSWFIFPSKSFGAIMLISIMVLIFCLQIIIAYIPVMLWVTIGVFVLGAITDFILGRK